jgi:glycosyltransferase involved in cell wall biosynthesis
MKTNNIGKWAFFQARWLSQHGVEVVMAMPNGAKNWGQKYIDAGIRVEEIDASLPTMKPWKIFNRIKKIREFIKKENPDILHYHYVTNIMMARIALRNIKIPRIYQIPGPLHLEQWFYRKAEYVLSTKDDYWVGTCKKTCEYYTNQGVSSDRLFLSYYGGYSGEDGIKYKKTGKLRKEFDIKEKEFLFGMVCMYYKPKAWLGHKRGIKGHEDFIDAFCLVKVKYPNIRGVVIGGPWLKAENYEQHIQKYAKSKCGDSIVFTGLRDNVNELYKDIDCAVHPSTTENLGAAAESLAAAVPTIASNVGGFPDVVIPFKTGLLCDKENYRDLAEKMIYAIENHSAMKKWAENGKELLDKLLDIEVTGKETLEIYNQILNMDRYKIGMKNDIKI